MLFQRSVLDMLVTYFTSLTSTISTTLFDTSRSYFSLTPFFSSMFLIFKCIIFLLFYFELIGLSYLLLLLLNNLLLIFSHCQFLVPLFPFQYLFTIFITLIFSIISFILPNLNLSLSLLVYFIHT